MLARKAGTQKWVPKSAGKSLATPLDGSETSKMGARPKRAPRKLCANWGLMYCGNVVRVERDLRAIGRQIDAPVAVERFDW